MRSSIVKIKEISSFLKGIARTPAGRWGNPDELAGTAVFLASPSFRSCHRYDHHRRWRFRDPVSSKLGYGPSNQRKSDFLFSPFKCSCPTPASWRLACLNSQLIEKLIWVRIATIAPRIARSASVGVSSVWTISAAIRNSRPAGDDTRADAAGLHVRRDYPVR
jgi:hypothetical protein